MKIFILLFIVIIIVFILLNYYNIKKNDNFIPIGLNHVENKILNQCQHFCKNKQVFVETKKLEITFATSLEFLKKII